jgi:hypothetical protein
MQTPMQRGHLTSADQADPSVAAYLAAMTTVRRLEAELSDARAIADASAAAIETHGQARGRLGRVAGALGVGEQSLHNQRQRGKNPRRPVPREIRRRILTDGEYATVLHRAGEEAHRARHELPDPALDAIVSGALAVVGLLTPPPAPDDDRCTAQFADPDGEWVQCQEDPHDSGPHDSGDWQWRDDDPSAVPACA